MLAQNLTICLPTLELEREEPIPSSPTTDHMDAMPSGKRQDIWDRAWLGCVKRSVVITDVLLEDILLLS